MENLEIYEKCRRVPEDAQRPINAGRLKGKTDINPMWRIKKLTEMFGPAGIGWYYDITKQWLEQGSNGEVCAFVNIDLYVRYNDEWSKPLRGTGGSAFIAKEKSGLYTSDECYKMALTDAISVACKALGMGADVYWSSKKESKYGRNAGNAPAMPPVQPDPISKEQKDKIYHLVKQLAEQMAVPANKILERIESGFGTNVESMTMAQGVNCYKQLAGSLKQPT